MITVAIALVIAVIGALMYALSSNGKVANLGLVIFACGMFWFTEQLTHGRLHL